MSDSDSEPEDVGQLKYPDNSILHLMCEAGDIVNFIEGHKAGPDRYTVGPEDLMRLRHLVKRAGLLAVLKKA